MQKFKFDCSLIWHLFRQNKKRYTIIIFFSVIITILLALFQRSEYEAIGSFREKQNKNGQVQSPLLDLVANGSLSGKFDNEAATIIQSQKLIGQTIRDLNMQAEIIDPAQNISFIQKISRNLKSSWAEINNYEQPILKDIQPDVFVSFIAYQAETPLLYKIVTEANSDKFRIYDSKNKLLKAATFGEKFEIENSVLTLKYHPNINTTSSKTYFIKIFPFNIILDRVKKRLRVDVNNKDKNLLAISFRDQNRFIAQKFVNQIMANYQLYIKKELDHQSQIQLSYLNQKKKESKAHLETQMIAHANLLAEDLSKSGFIDTEQEISFLANSQSEIKNRLINNELEIKRLQKLQEGKCAYYDQYHKGMDNHSVINGVLKEIRDCKQQKDALILALNESPISDPQTTDKAFEDFHQTLTQHSQNLIEVEYLINNLEQDKAIDSSLAIINNPKFLLKQWQTKLALNSHLSKYDFQKYLKLIKRTLQMQIAVIKKRLLYQQRPLQEHQGVTLESAQKIYMDYSHKLNNLESDIKANDFIISQLTNRDFEISSLSSSLQDPVSSEVLQKAGKISLELQDFENRSDRELKHLSDELQLQRTFLLMHLQQSNEINILNKNLFKTKIANIQNLILELTHQKISVLEKNLRDFIQTRLLNIAQENDLLTKHMIEQQTSMTSLPKRWISEKIMRQNLDMDEAIVKEVAKLVESKNISQQLELVQSAPLDQAALPAFPRSLHLPIFAFMGALLGGLICFCISLKKIQFGKFKVTKAALQSLHQTVITKDGANTFIRIKNWLTKKELPKPTITLINLKDVAQTQALLQSISHEGTNILTLLLYDAPEIDPSNLNIQTLSDESQLKKIISESTNLFEQILILSSEETTSPNLETKALLADSCLLEIDNERLDQLKFFINLDTSNNKNIAFLLQKRGY